MSLSLHYHAIFLILYHIHFYFQQLVLDPKKLIPTIYYHNTHQFLEIFQQIQFLLQILYLQILKVAILAQFMSKVIEKNIQFLLMNTTR
jgi:hypothetical protein